MMEQNNLFNERYFLERLLGRGNFSEVWLAKDTKTDIRVALKIYAPATGLDDAGLNVFAREFSLVVNANHKNLLKPLYYDSCDRKPFLVLPYCEKGSILKQVGLMSEEDVWHLLMDVAGGLSWLHRMNPPIIHQDIKPDNIMIGDNGDYMITDFGVSTHVKSTLRKSLSSAFSSAGTIAYMAPERFSKDNTPIMANDIYSLGATAYEMLTGDTPFGDDGGLIQMKGAEVPELKGNYSTQLKEVIGRCLRTNPWERPTAEQLEEYAALGLQGKKIHFQNDKPIWQKNKLVLVIAAIIIFVALIGGGLFVHNNNERAAEELKLQQIQAHNDSIHQSIKQLVYKADSLSLVGDAHGEGYEVAYIEAYMEYKQVLDAGNSLMDGDSIKNMDVIESNMRNLEAKLIEAYSSLMEKASLFEDDVEIASEFNARASKISELIDITESNKN